MINTDSQLCRLLNIQARFSEFAKQDITCIRHLEEPEGGGGIGGLRRALPQAS